jgi:hypothetical protein
MALDAIAAVLDIAMARSAQIEKAAPKAGGPTECSLVTQA